MQTKEALKGNIYSAYTADEVINHTNQSHWNKNEKEQLNNILKEFEENFQGRPGTFKGLDVDFHLKEGVRSFYDRSYSMPEAYKDVFKWVLDNMCKHNVLEKIYKDTDWSSPTFGVPKKKKTIQVVSNFHWLNQAIKRSP